MSRISRNIAGAEHIKILLSDQTLQWNQVQLTIATCKWPMSIEVFNTSRQHMLQFSCWA